MAGHFITNHSLVHSCRRCGGDCDRQQFSEVLFVSRPRNWIMTRRRNGRERELANWTNPRVKLWRWFCNQQRGRGLRPLDGRHWWWWKWVGHWIAVPRTRNNSILTGWEQKQVIGGRRINFGKRIPTVCFAGQQPFGNRRLVTRGAIPPPPSKGTCGRWWRISE